MGKLARPHHETGKTTRSTGMAPLTEADIKIINRVEELANSKGWVSHCPHLFFELAASHRYNSVELT